MTAIIDKLINKRFWMGVYILELCLLIGVAAWGYYVSNDIPYKARTTEELIDMADDGNTTAMLELGRRSIDPKESVHWVMRAAELGDADAQMKLGVGYYNGVYGVLGVDLKTSFEWLLKAAEQNHPLAMQQVAFYYLDGIGVQQNNAETYKWAKKGAELGYIECYVAYGICFNRGLGTSKDEKEAFKWYKKAADADYPEGLSWVAECYNKGCGVEVNKEIALRYYRRAAEKGDEYAKKILQENPSLLN